MNKSAYTLIVFYILLSLSSCGNKENEQAIQYLENIRSLSEIGHYEEALGKIDSIQVLFPKAFKEIKEGLALKQDVRKAMNEKQIAVCDSLMNIYQPKIDSLKQLFVLKQDKEYQDKGIYIPKSVNANTLTSTMLRAGVNEDGSMYIESVYIGGQLHDAIMVTTSQKQFVETLPITDDGLNFRFSNLGKQYEVIKVTPAHDNGLAKFIYSFTDQPLTVVLLHKTTAPTRYPLNNVQKKAITDSYQLSTWMLQQDSLMTAKGKAETLLKYLESKNNE